MSSFISSKKPTAPKPDHMGEKQTIPARHGTATFVPKGHTIKIINTYGSQVVDTWAFVLGRPPTDGDIDQDGKAEANGEQKSEEKEEQAEAGAQERQRNGEARKQGEDEEDSGVAKKVSDTTEEVQDKAGDAAGKAKDTAYKTTEQVEDAGEQSKEGAQKVTEKVENDAGAKKTGWTAYIPSVRGRGKQASDTANEATTDTTKPATNAKDKTEETTKKNTDGAAKSSSWSSYIPSVRSSKLNPQQQRTKEQKEKEAKGWSAYLPSGQGFSAYLPSGKGPTLSAFVANHQRDPTKSYAEQLYDFSKTPVGAASLSGKFPAGRDSKH
jgi:Domain of unknown function (DUF1989)